MLQLTQFRGDDCLPVTCFIIPLIRIIVVKTIFKIVLCIVQCLIHRIPYFPGITVNHRHNYAGGDVEQQLPMHNGGGRKRGAVRKGTGDMDFIPPDVKDDSGAARLVTPVDEGCFIPSPVAEHNRIRAAGQPVKCIEIAHG